MPDVVRLLEDLAERGEPRGADEVLRRAVARASNPGEPPHRPTRLLFVVAAAAVVVVGTVLVVSRPEPRTEVQTSAGETSAEALRGGDAGRLIWASRDGVVVADPRSEAQTRLVDGESSCGAVRIGDDVYVGQPGVRIDARDLSVQRLPISGCVFADVGASALYVVLSVETTATGTVTEIDRVDRSGRHVAGPWTLPSGQVLTQPARAVTGGVLVESDENGADHTLSIWNPDTGEVTPVGSSRWLIDTFTAADGGAELVAYVAAGCDDSTSCAIEIADLRGGDTIRVDAPEGSAGYFGGGAFSPDGAELAAFASHPPPENVNPSVDLVIVNVATASTARIDDSTVLVGEPYGFATWTPDGRWLYFGGLSAHLRAHVRSSTDAVELALPSEYATVAIAAPDTTTPTATVAAGVALADVDWEAARYPLDCGGMGTRVLQIVPTQPAAGVAVVVVLVACDAGAGSPPRTVYVYDRADSRTEPHLLQVLWEDGRYRLTGTVASDGAALTATGSTYSSSDIPRCCPDGTFTTTWTWTDDGYLQLSTDAPPFEP